MLRLWFYNTKTGHVAKGTGNVDWDDESWNYWLQWIMRDAEDHIIFFLTLDTTDVFEEIKL